MNNHVLHDHLLEVVDLHTEFPTRHGAVRAVDGVSLRISPGEMVGLVGESGSGKTMLALSILGLVPAPGRITSGAVRFAGRDVLAMDQEEVRRLRGGELAMSFQDPMTSLHPLMRIRAQITEAMTVHDRFQPEAARDRVVPLLRQVQIAGARQRGEDYPHQFSGGMRQRAMIAMGLANEPRLLIADEITTALDTVTQAEIVALLGGLNRDLESAILLITHNMALVRQLCARVVVMYAGQVVEEGPVDVVFERPQHPYTWALVRSLPRSDRPRRERLITIGGSPPELSALPLGCRFHPRCPFVEDRCVHELPSLARLEHQAARCWVLMDNVAGPLATTDPSSVDVSVDLRPSSLSGPEAGREVPLLRVEDLATHFSGPGGTQIKAVDGVSFDIRRGETLALIGESGCGKTTLARTVARLLRATSGRVLFDGQDVANARGSRLRAIRRRMQIIFQDPFSALDPRMKVGEVVAEPLDNFVNLSRRDRSARVCELLERVGLSSSAADRYPHEFSGGQRQRIGVARALSLEPALIVCDEPVSALDVSIQAQIVNLLADLQHDLGIAYLFIAHDLGVVRHLSDRVAVMYLGRIIELGEADDLFAHPQHPYTELLLASALTHSGDAWRLPVRSPAREAPSSLNPPSGCHFHPRCSRAQVPGICSQEYPRLERHGRATQEAACHLADGIASHHRPQMEGSGEAG